MPVLKYMKLDPRAVDPFYATDGAACFDLTAIGREGAVFSTGLAFDIPTGYVLKVYSRSGHGFHDNTRLANGVGVIDSDYSGETGEIKVKLARDDGRDLDVRVGDRVAQAMLIKLPKVALKKVQELKKTKRGGNGFGSTGR